MTGLGLIVTYNINNSLTDIIKQKWLDMFMFIVYYIFFRASRTDRFSARVMECVNNMVRDIDDGKFLALLYQNHALTNTPSAWYCAAASFAIVGHHYSAKSLHF